MTAKRSRPAHVGGFLQPASGRQSGDASTNRWWIGKAANHGAVVQNAKGEDGSRRRFCPVVLIDVVATGSGGFKRVHTANPRVASTIDAVVLARLDRR